jgi:hypothetical protein
MVGFAWSAWGDIIMVTNTANSGPGSFQQAIVTANTNLGVNTISFQISGTPPFTITPTNALPQITATVVIDGTTQAGYVNAPIIELNGLSAGAGAVGLKLGATAGFSTVRGLVINRFSGSGMELNSASNTIVGNYIGTDVTGTLARGNGAASAAYGIFVKSAGNCIGGTTAADRNVISGNNDTGIYILTAGGNVVQGNWIGINAANTAALGNAYDGVVIYNSAGNLIGGTNVGAGNVISGNPASGIFLDLAGATGNLIQGNRIGMDAAGAVTVSNAGDGITLLTAPGNWIGPGNLISGNGLAGVSIQGASSNMVTGNFIGTDATGNLARPNYSAGVSVWGASGNQIGGTNAGAGNLISGNTYNGIQLLTNNTTFATGTLIQGNLIGVNAGGTNALRNGYQGIVLSGATSNLIGGPVAGARNVISGNASNGVFIASLTDSNNILQGNYIGTDVNGLKTVANGWDGVHLQARANLIGGTTPGCRNVISGNTKKGIFLVGTGGNVSGNVIQGNFIGLDATGSTSLPNNDSGLGISDAASNLIGGTVAGAGNVISGNSPHGIFLTVAGSTGNQIQGNFIGTDATGTVARGNSQIGVYSLLAAGACLIGGSVPGAGNVISANGQSGNWASIYLTSSAGNVIQGNFIGTQADGVSALSNYGHGIDLQSGAINNIIGGTNAGAGNRIGFMQISPRSGVRVRNGAYNNLISGNSIFSNAELGIDLDPTLGVNLNTDCESGMNSTVANFGQNYPVLTNVISGVNTRIRGYLDSSINQTYRLQFFASPTGNASGYGEGFLFLGEQSFALGGNCTSSFSVTLPVSVPAGWVVTATATNPNNNTSEFSAYIYATNVPPLAISAAGPGQQSVSWTNSSGPFTLQQTYSLNPPITWLTVTSLPVLSNGNYSVTVVTTNANVFYHLIAP